MEDDEEANTTKESIEEQTGMAAALALSKQLARYHVRKRADVALNI